MEWQSRLKMNDFQSLSINHIYTIHEKTYYTCHENMWSSGIPLQTKYSSKFS